MPHATGSIKEDFDRDGYVIVPSALSDEQIEDLRAACRHVVFLAREGMWPHVRTLPRQFPPWPAADLTNGIWGVQKLMHPDLPGHELFTKSYFSSSTIATVQELLGNCSKDDLVMELYNLLVRPDKDFELRWHRDDIPPTATAEQEMERLNKPAYHAQWNFSLYDDSSLIVVPGSHRRPRDEEERQADPLEPNMPSQLTVQLRAGDMVFYNNNILHRGVYRHNVERMTLHGSMGHAQAGSLRARNVLQHGRDWIDRVDLSEVEDVRTAEGMRDKLIELAANHQETGYAHDD